MTERSIEPQRCIWGTLTEFDLDLVTGERIWISATAYHEEAGEFVFSILMKGSPAFDVEVARVPAHLIAPRDRHEDDPGRSRLGS